MTVINTNINANIARDAIGRNDRAMATSMERLSTGLRINSAKDDAAGLAIANRMAGQISGLNMAKRNANDGMSMIQTIEGATKEVGNMLVRMRELAVQSASGTYSDSDRAALDLEFDQLRSEITRIQEKTTWNNQALMDGGKDVNIQLGASSGQTMKVTFADWSVQDEAVYGTAAVAADAVEAAEAKTEKATVTFVGLDAAETVVIGGITLTAVSAVTAEQVAAAFADPTAEIPVDGDNAAIFSLSSESYSAEFAYTAAAVDGEATKVQFTAKSAGAEENLTVGDLDVSIDLDGAAAVEAKEAVVGETTVNLISIHDAAGAAAAIVTLDKAITGVTAEQAKYGAYLSRLQYASDNISNVATNLDQSRSRIQDADYAVETTALARTQIIAQASTAMLAQANQVKQTVLALLQ